MESQENVFSQNVTGTYDHKNDKWKNECAKRGFRTISRMYNPYARRAMVSSRSNLPIAGFSTSNTNSGTFESSNKSETHSNLTTYDSSQCSLIDLIPCNQAQNVSNMVSEKSMGKDLSSFEHFTLNDDDTSLKNQNLFGEISQNEIVNEALNENLSKSQLASFEESFHQCKGDLNHNKTFSQIFKTSEVQNMSISNKPNADSVQKQNNQLKEFVNDINDSFMLNVSPKIRESILLKESNYFYGLPLVAKSLVCKYKGIEKLYDWQNECLTLRAVEERQNLIYALPTSGGKTLVAEILMLKEVTCRNKNVLFVLPFVSIVQEKVAGLSPFAVSLDFFVEEYAGGKGVYPPKKRRKKKSIYIATIEKGLGLVRSLIETKRISEIGLIVVDELHLLGEPRRGCMLEMLLTNVMFSEENIQIIGMSATIGNLDELAKFLKAKIFTKDFRPVELKEYVKYGKDIMSIDWKSSQESQKLVHSRTVDYGYSSDVEKIDPDHLGGLVLEVIPSSSCLIFCPTKKNSENVAVLLCRVIAKAILEHRKQEKSALLRELKRENNGKNLLLDLVPWGVAFHHSGLAFEERRLIEDAFRSGVLCVLCCTSTLAAGVNLPAQRVILRAPMVGRSFMNLTTYKQMVGRAGRAGFGGHGDSILICNDYHREQVKTLLNSPMDDVCSGLHTNGSTNMRTFLLSAVASETATNLRALKNLTNQTLMAVQAEKFNIITKQIVSETVKDLFKMRAITKKNDQSGDILTLNSSVIIDKSMKQDSEFSNVTVNTKEKHISISNNTEFVVSKLGKAAVKGGMELSRARELYADLKTAQNCLVLIGVGHLLYLVTPYDLSESIKPNLSVFYSVLSSANPDIEETSRCLGFTEAIKVKMAMGKYPKSIPERILNRFYVTLMLYDLWNQVSLQTVSEKFQVNRGTVQSMMEQAATFASGVLRFCEEIEEFWAFKDLLKTFSLRLSHCCILELDPLMELPCVKKNRALQLYKAGFKTIKSIAVAKNVDLVEAIEHLNIKTANQLIAAAQLSLLEKVENLRDEEQNLMEDLGVEFGNNT